MKNACHLYHQCGTNQRARNSARLLVTANAVPSSPILVTMMMEAARSFETLVLTKVTGEASQKTAFFLSTDVFPLRYEHQLHIKSKAIPATGRGRPIGS
jgi:hypothetical protein